MKRKNADDAYERPFSGCGLFLWVAVILFAAAIGCMTAKKAEKAVTKFPEVAERVLLNGLPRIVIHDTVINTEVDSSGFWESIMEANDASARSGSYIDSLQNRINQLSVEAKEGCVDFLLINEALKTENKTLNRLMANMKPIKVIERKEYWIEDSLKVKLFRIEFGRKSDTLTKTKAELKVFKDKAKGKWTIYISKFWFWFFVFGLGIGAFLKYKKFNLKKLIGK